MKKILLLFLSLLFATSILFAGESFGSAYGKLFGKQVRMFDTFGYASYENPFAFTKQVKATNGSGRIEEVSRMGFSGTLMTYRGGSVGASFTFALPFNTFMPTTPVLKDVALAVGVRHNNDMAVATSTTIGVNLGAQFLPEFKFFLEGDVSLNTYRFATFYGDDISITTTTWDLAGSIAYELTENVVIGFNVDAIASSLKEGDIPLFGASLAYHKDFYSFGVHIGQYHLSSGVASSFFGFSGSVAINDNFELVAVIDEYNNFELFDFGFGGAYRINNIVIALSAKINTRMLQEYSVTVSF